MIADYLRKIEAEIRDRPKVPDMLFMTRRTWMMLAKQSIKEGITIEYRHYMHARRFRFFGGIPVRVWKYAEEGKIFPFYAPKFSMRIEFR